MAVQESRRERKAQRTRREIVRAACELVIEDGYERATIARIAERADLASRTVTTRFLTKEAIFFEGLSDALSRAEAMLESGEGDTVDRLRAWIGQMAEQEARDADELELRALRSRAIAHDPDLRALFAQHFDRAHTAIARAVADEKDVSPEATGPQMVAAAAIAMLRVVERLASEDDAQALLELERGFTVLRGALAAVSG
jgi:AcrR family transcriptional regulator